MKSSARVSELQICVLGAVNGLLVGITFEVLRIIYVNYQMQRVIEEAVQREGNIGYMLHPTINSFIPFVCVITFTAASHLVHKYFIHRPQPLLLVWFLISLIAISVWRYMSPLSQGGFSFIYIMAFAAVAYLVHWCWRSHLHSRLMLWVVIGITAILSVVAPVQIIGLFMVQKYELRQPLTWLFCLVLVIIINFSYGMVIQGILPRYSPDKT